MKLDRVFVGFTLDGKEHLLYKRYGTYDNGVNYTYYIDLESDIILEPYEIDTNTLIPFSKIIKTDNKRMMRRKVIKNYKTDREQLVDVKKVFYGNIVKRYKKPERYFMESVLKSNLLFSSLLDSKVKALQTSNVFYSTERVLKGFAVKKVRNIDCDQFEDLMQPKRKILEMDYRKEL